MKYNINILPLADHYVVVAKDKSTGETKQVFNINESGAEMLSLLCADHETGEVARILADKYDVDIDIVSSDVNAFVSSLATKGIID